MCFRFSYKMKRRTRSTTTIVLYILVLYVLLDLFLFHMLQSFRARTTYSTLKDPDSLEVIPQMIHQLCSHGIRCSEQLDNLSLSWKRHHPDWNHTVWTVLQISPIVDVHLPWFKDVYDGYKDPIYRAQAAQYILLFVFGGFYADTDVECLQSFQSLRHKGGLVLAGLGQNMSDEYSLPRAVVGSVRGHPFFLHLLRRLNETGSDISRYEDPSNVSGAVFFHREFSTFLDSYGDTLDDIHSISILNSETFYPYNWNVPSEYSRICSAHSKRFSPRQCKREHSTVMLSKPYSFAFKSNRWDTRSQFERAYHLRV